MNYRETCLRAANDCVNGMREQDYGTPEDNFGTIARLWSEYLGRENIVISPKDVPIMMALLKIARIKTGGGTGDSYIDLAGYAACAYEIAVNEAVDEALNEKEDENNGNNE